MTKDAKRAQDQNTNAGVSVCIITPTGRIKEIGTLINEELGVAAMAMVEVSRFLKCIRECEGEPGRSEQLIADTIRDVLNHDFEVGLATDYAMYKISPDDRVYGCCHAKVMIEKFVKTIGLTNFSDYFQTEWGKMQPVTYRFGTTDFTIGKDPCGPIDILIDLLDELDDRRSELGDNKKLPEYHMLQLRLALADWSPIILTLDELIRLSDSAPDKRCAGYAFVNGLVDRIGLENLPQKTQENYRRVFLPN